jgi:DNA-binding GntR family transcriptional regulator
MIHRRPLRAILSIIYNTNVKTENGTLDRESMSDRVRNAILRRIAEGVYVPGQRLIEMQLAAEFGTSQAPVREALRELETLHVVEVKRYCGARVREISPKERLDAYQVRAVLEQFAAELAADRIGGDVRELRGLAKEIPKAAKKGDVPAYAEKDLPFHHRIVELSGNEVLLRKWEDLGFELQTRVHLSQNKSRIKHNAMAHFQIVDALEQGNGQTAGRLLREHAMSFLLDE